MLLNLILLVFVLLVLIRNETVETHIEVVVGSKEGDGLVSLSHRLVYSLRVTTALTLSATSATDPSGHITFCSYQRGQ